MSQLKRYYISIPTTIYTHSHTKKYKRRNMKKTLYIIIAICAILMVAIQQIDHACLLGILGLHVLKMEE